MKKQMKQRFVTVAVIALTIRVFAQGSLTPPGAPDATMKTLEQVESRTPISSLPCVITNSGSYYVTGNLMTTGHGIRITASQVTVDLQGFTITGDKGGGDFGIYVAGTTNAPVQDIVVKNGHVSTFGVGLNCFLMDNSRIEQITFSDVHYNGIKMESANGQCNGNVIADCSVIRCNTASIWLRPSSGQMNGNTFANCTVLDGGDNGFYVYNENGEFNGNSFISCVVRGCVRSGISIMNMSGSEASGNLFNGCVVSDCLQPGIYLYSNASTASGNRFAGCISTECLLGFYLYSNSGVMNGNTFAECSASLNIEEGFELYAYNTGGELNNNSISSCSFTDNGSSGIYMHQNSNALLMGTRIEKCNISGNDYGIQLSGSGCTGSLILENQVSNNGLRGIYINSGSFNRVEANAIIGHTLNGVYSGGGQGNFFARNVGSNTGVDFTFETTDVYGPIILSASGALSDTGAESHPLANFSN